MPLIAPIVNRQSASGIAQPKYGGRATRITSGYEWLHGDLLTDGRRSGLFCEDSQKRRFTIDLDKNQDAPPKNMARVEKRDDADG